MSEHQEILYAIAKQARSINAIETDYGQMDVIALLSPLRRTVLKNTLIKLLKEELAATQEGA